MADSPKNPATRDEPAFLSTDCRIVEIKEEDTQPGKASERYRKLLEEKYGRKRPSSDGPAAPAA